MKIGSYVIVRCSAAGVHAGELVRQDGQTVELRNARRLWYWRVPLGAPAFLSGVASHGLDPTDCKLGAPIHVVLLDACEVIETSDVARDTIRNYPTHTRTQ